MKGKTSRSNCGYAYGGAAPKMRNIGGVKAPAYGSNDSVMKQAKSGTTGKVGMDGIGANGVPAKGRLDKPKRKMKKGGDADEDDRRYARGGKLTTAARDQIADKNFALPDRRYPIENPSHARNALSRVSANGTPAEKAKVRSAVHRKYPSIGKK